MSIVKIDDGEVRLEAVEEPVDGDLIRVWDSGADLGTVNRFGFYIQILNLALDALKTGDVLSLRLFRSGQTLPLIEFGPVIASKTDIGGTAKVMADEAQAEMDNNEWPSCTFRAVAFLANGAIMSTYCNLRRSSDK